MKKWILVIGLALLLFVSTSKAQEGKSIENAEVGDVLGADISLGYSNLLFDSVSSNGFNIGIALLNISKTTGMNYGLDCSYSGYLKKDFDYQSILSMGPSTGIRFCNKSGFAFEIGLTTGLSLVKLNDINGLPYDGACFNGKSKMSIGYKKCTLNLEGCYYSSSKFDFSSFSVNFKYMIIDE